MGKFSSLGISFKAHPDRAKSPLPAAALPAAVLTAPAAIAASAPELPSAPPSGTGPLTLGHKHQHDQVQQQQQLPYSIGDVVVEEAAQLCLPAAVASRLQGSNLVVNSSSHAAGNKLAHDLHSPQPQAQAQYSNLAGRMLRMVNELRATGAAGRVSSSRRVLAAASTGCITLHGS
jgi:hypothetical protein